MNDFIYNPSSFLPTVFRTALLFRLFVNDLINGRSHGSFPYTLRNIEDDEGVQEKHISDDGTLLFPGEAKKMKQASNSIMIVMKMNKAKKTVVKWPVWILNFLLGLSEQKDVLDAQMLRISLAEFEKLCTDFSIATPERGDAREPRNSSENI